MSMLPFEMDLFRIEAQEEIERMGTEITLGWTTYSTDEDGAYDDYPGDAGTAQTDTIYGYIKRVHPRDTRPFSGDGVLGDAPTQDYLVWLKSSVDLSGKENVTFTLPTGLVLVPVQDPPDVALFQL